MKGSTQGLPEEPVNDNCKVQSNDGHGIAHSSTEGATQRPDRMTKCKTSRWLRLSQGGTGTTRGRSDKANNPAKDSSQEESMQQKPRTTDAGLPAGMERLMQQ